MHNSLRLASRVRTSSVLPVRHVYPFPSTTVNPLLTTCYQPPQLPTLYPGLQQHVLRYSCGECPPSKSSDSGEKKKKDKNGKKGGQCATIKGRKGSSKENGGQCSTVKGKDKKGKQCSEVKGKRGQSKETNKETSADKSCGPLDAAKDVAKARTIICEGDGEKDVDKKVSDKPSKKQSKKEKTVAKSSSSSSSSSSSDGECSEEDKKKDKRKDESESSEDELPSKECAEEIIDPAQEEKNEQAIAEMCNCIQSALNQTEAGKKPGDGRKPQPKATQAKPSSCGSPLKKYSTPKVSEHVRCCQVETSKTAQLKSGASSCEERKKKAEKDKKETADQDCDDDGGAGGKGDVMFDPCDCIKKALNKCKKGSSKKTDKSKSKKSAKKDESKKSAEKGESKEGSCGPLDGSKKEESSGEEEPSQCGAQENKVSFGKKNCKSKEYTVKCR